MQYTGLKALILDMDGVLWRGDEWLVDAAAVFTRLAAAGICVGLATNNATRTQRYYVDKFAAVGAALDPEQIVNSAIAAAHHLAARFPERGDLLVVGEWGLAQTMENHGFRVDGADPIAVVCGLDRQLTYEKIKAASTAIRAGAEFIGTNPDKTFPTPDGLVPGAGAILAALEAASGVSPTITGKPEPAMYEILLRHFNVNPAETLVVGDRLDTDIAGGLALGCRTALVLSGVATPAEAEASERRPDRIFADLNAVMEALPV